LEVFILARSVRISGETGRIVTKTKGRAGEPEILTLALSA
jgi:hypothetical protein